LRSPGSPNLCFGNEARRAAVILGPRLGTAINLNEKSPGHRHFALLARSGMARRVLG
jgi:hypothetical protein